jgi:hypothetical protein
MDAAGEPRMPVGMASHPKEVLSDPSVSAAWKAAVAR